MGQLTVILREDVPRLGDAGALVAVKPGYARNYLLPTGKAILATRSNVRELEHQQRVVAQRVEAERRKLEALRDRIQSIELEVAAKVGEGGKLFGSVTAPQIAELLQQKGVEVDRRRIQLDEPIREAGEHTVAIRLKHELSAQIKVKVVPAE